MILRLPNGLDFSDLSPEFNSPNGILTPVHQGIANPTFTPDVNNTSGLLHIDSNMNLSSLVCTPYPNSQDGMYSNNTSFTIPQLPPMPNMQNENKKYEKASRKEAITYLTKTGSEVPKDILDAVTVFTRKQEKGTIDIYWLYDDGGLTMLLPYIISMRSTFEKCKLRIFALTNRRQELEMEEKK